MYNTPAAFPIYVTGLNVSYMNQMGGLEYYIMAANQRAEMLWNIIDNSSGYYKSNLTDKAYRSRTNVIFRICEGDKDREAKFIKEAADVGIVQILGHGFNPGVRICMYNAMPLEGVHYLTNFMRLFMKNNAHPKYQNARM